MYSGKERQHWGPSGLCDVIAPQSVHGGENVEDLIS